MYIQRHAFFFLIFCIDFLPFHKQQPLCHVGLRERTGIVIDGKSFHLALCKYSTKHFCTVLLEGKHFNIYLYIIYTYIEAGGDKFSKIQEKVGGTVYC